MCEKYDVSYCMSRPIKGLMLIAMIEISREEITLSMERETNTMFEVV